MSAAAENHVREFVNSRRDFTIIHQDESSITLEGCYSLFAEHDDVLLADDYRLKIDVPFDYPVAIPSVYEICGLIPSDYPHKYSDGRLCLGIDGEIVASLEEDSSLDIFLESYVRDALYSANYYYRYGRFPFGDRDHGAIGVLSYYAELFDVDIRTSLDLLVCVAGKSYRGHLPCPCGSGLRTRNCHGPDLLAIIRTPSRQLAAETDFGQVIKELEFYARSEKEKEEAQARFNVWQASRKASHVHQIGCEKPFLRG